MTLQIQMYLRKFCAVQNRYTMEEYKDEYNSLLKCSL